jgi:hypothetical protein
MTPDAPPQVAPRGSLFLARFLLVAALSGVLLWASSPGYAAGIIPGANPKANISPSPDFNQSGQCTKSGTGWSCDNPCVSSKLTFPIYANTPACSAFVLEAISNARKAEGLGAMVLPTNWSSLTAQQQLFVIADLERTARGLPPYLGLNAALTTEAQHAAANDTDPGLAKGFSAGIDPQGYYGMGGTWASGFTTLGANYFWMYADGWGGSAAKTSNLDCTSAKAPACWAHRDELLGYDPAYNPGVGLNCKTCEMGTGFAITHGYASFADLIELPAGAPPPMTFTWSKNVLPYLPKSSPPPAAKHTKVTTKTVTRRAAPAAAWRLSAPTPGVVPLCARGHGHGHGSQLACKSHKGGHKGANK